MKDSNGKTIRDSEYFRELAKKRKNPAYNFKNPEVQKKATEGKKRYWERIKKEYGSNK